jgi:hypothetical protein
MPKDIEQEIYEEMYKDAPRHNIQVKVLNEHGEQVRDAELMTEDEVIALIETLPEGWTVEEV